MLKLATQEMQRSINSNTNVLSFHVKNMFVATGQETRQDTAGTHRLMKTFFRISSENLISDEIFSLITETDERQSR